MKASRPSKNIFEVPLRQHFGRETFDILCSIERTPASFASNASPSRQAAVPLPEFRWTFNDFVEGAPGDDGGSNSFIQFDFSPKNDYTIKIKHISDNEMLFNEDKDADKK